MYFNEYECKKCGETCIADGDYPKFFCWCDECDDYAAGFDPTEYAAIVLANHIEAAELRMDME